MEDAIGDYQFELSNRADMRWPLSMCFYKLISKTSDGVREKRQTRRRKRHQSPIHIASTGFANAGQTVLLAGPSHGRQRGVGKLESDLEFYRACSGLSVDVTLDYDSTRGTGVLRWKANAAGGGRPNTGFMGATKKDSPWRMTRSQARSGLRRKRWRRGLASFPANFIAETTGTELPVLGRDVSLPAANKTYYRVVAVDEQGKLSGASDYASAPRPVIYSAPVVTVKAGAEYRYPVLATRSLGDISARMNNGRQVNGYFDIEKPKFAVERGPAWLKIDENTGLLSGTPDLPGKSDVVVTAHIERDVRKLDEQTLRWGNEKLLSLDKERIGTETQTFVIDVSK